MKNIAIIVAGGVGTRMGYDLPKQYLKVRDKPILYYTIQSFIKNSNIDGIIIVIRESDLDLYEETILLIKENRQKLLGYCFGGKQRSDSVYHGLVKAQEYQAKNILIHDGARPFVAHDIIDNIVNTLDNEQDNAVLVGIPVVDTLQYCQDNKVEKVVDRTNLWQAQTPQAFDFNMILQAYSTLITKEDLALTDDVSVWKAFYKDSDSNSNYDSNNNQQVKIILGSDKLFKVTLKSDLQKVKDHILLEELRNN